MRIEGLEGRYRGSSFSELLDVDYPQLRWDPSSWLEGGVSKLSVPHGTTVLSFKFADGVIVAGDRLATEGLRVASRDVQKVYATDAHSMIAIAGAAGPAIEMARLMRIELEHYEKIEGEALELDGKANKLSQMIRANLPAAMQGLVVVPLFAGYDLRRHQGRMWKFDVTGGRYEEADFESTGSGGLYARESLKKSHRPDASKAEALQMAVQALTDAADEDRGTGGIDTLRGIFPTVIFCSERGIERAPESEIHHAYDHVIAHRNGGAHVETTREHAVRPEREGLGMSMPFYVSPEQVMQDKAEYARKGISRGKSSITLEYDGGIALMAVNPSSLSKIGEIYDRIAFAGVGKFSEFDQLRKIGARYADVKGYSYSRDDVRGKALANAYSQAMGDVFTRELKPLEVEVIVVEVGDPTLAGHEDNAIYRIQFDGSISDHEGFCVIGGSAEELVSFLQGQYRDGLPLGDATRLGRSALSRAADGQVSVPPANLEVCVLEKARSGRKFRRLSTDEVGGLLGA